MRVVVIFPGALGDLCLLVPALSSLGAGVELSVQRTLVPVAGALLPHVTPGPPFDGTVMASLFGDALAPELREWLGGADRVHAWLARSATDGRLCARLAAAGVAAPSLHAVPRDDGDSHVGEEYARALGVAPSQTFPHVTRVPTTSWPGRHPPAERLILHPGAGARAKQWGIDGFRKIADAWIAAGGDAVVLLGPAEEESAGRWRAAGYEVVAGLAIADAMALIASASCWIGNDSGMSHLAGALGRRGVVLFGPTRPARWRPLGGDLTTVEFGGRYVEDVAQEVRAILEGLRASS